MGLLSMMGIGNPLSGLTNVLDMAKQGGAAPLPAATPDQNPFSSLIQQVLGPLAPQQAEAPQVASTPEQEYFGEQPSTTYRDAEEAGLAKERAAAPQVRRSVSQPPNWAAERAGIFKGESGGDYNALFGFSNRPGKRFANVRLTDMTVDEAINFARPSGEYGQWVKGQIGRVATPMGGYQVVGTTLRAAKKAMGLTGKERMTPAQQEEIGKWIRANQGLSAWEGYRGHGDPNEFPMNADVVGRPPAMLSGIGSPNDPTLQAPDHALVAQVGPPEGQITKKARKPLKGRQGKLFPNASAGGAAQASGGGGADRRTAPGVQMTDYKSKLKPELLKQLDRGNMLALLQAVGAQARGGGTSI